jgi:hypothetical protein
MAKKQATLITDAARSPAEQFRSRQVRYVSMMGIRALCLVLGGVLISLQVPLLPLWLGLCVLGMVLLPWMAVLVANDRAPKTKAERRQAAAAATGREQRALRADAPRPDRTIDVEP